MCLTFIWQSISAFRRFDSSWNPCIILCSFLMLLSILSMLFRTKINNQGFVKGPGPPKSPKLSNRMYGLKLTFCSRVIKYFCQRFFFYFSFYFDSIHQRLPWFYEASFFQMRATRIIFRAPRQFMVPSVFGGEVTSLEPESFVTKNYLKR